MNRTVLKKIFKKLELLISTAWDKLSKLSNKFPYRIGIIKKRSKGRSPKDVYAKLGLAVLLVMILLPVALFIDYTTTSAFLLDRESRLAQHLAAQDVPVGKKIVGEERYEQIYYKFEGEEILVTDSRTAKGVPNTDEEYITWMEEISGTWQVFLYHIPTEQLMQLTNSGNNVDPEVSNGKVVWEGWSENSQNPDGSFGNWQVFVYDGKVIRQISQGNLSESPDIDNEFVVFSQKYDQGWKNFAYSLQADSLKEIHSDFSAGDYVEIRDGDIFYGRGRGDRTKFPQKVNELFLLDLPFEPEPGQPEQVTRDNMREYLERLIEDAESLDQTRQANEPVLGIEEVIDDIESATGSAQQASPTPETTTAPATESGQLE